MKHALAALLAILLTAFALAANPVQCTPKPLRAYARDLRAAAAEFAVPESVLEAVVMQESSGDATASLYYAGSGPELEALYRSQAPRWDAALAMGWTYRELASSLGLTQMLGSTAWEMGAHYPPEALLQPNLSLRLGARYLAAMHARFGNWSDALKAYNAGPHNLRAGATYARQVTLRMEGIRACRDSLK